MTATATFDQPDNSTALSRALVLVTVSLCTMLYALTVTVVNVALPQIQGSLSATPDQVSWVVTLNILATAVTTPLTGWMVARLGQRKVMLWSVVGFAVTSLLCASANTLAPLLAYRIGQGIFGAPLVPLAQAILVATYPPDQRAMAQGFFGMSVVLGPALAPAIGGYLAEHYNWRWIFLLIVPVCIAAFFFALAFIKDGGKREDARLNWTGFITLSVAVSCLQLIMDRGERLDWFESTELLLAVGVMLASFYMFVVHTLTDDHPFISPALFRDRNFVLGLALVFIYGMLNFTPTVLLPPLLQNLKGYPDSLIGLLLAARGAGMVIGFFSAARMGRFDPRVGLIIGLLMVGLSGWRMTTFDLNVAPFEVAWVGVLQGVGTGLMWVPLSVVTFASLPTRLLPDASAVFHLLRNFGSSIFISLSVWTVVRYSKVNYAELTENVSAFNENLKLPGVIGQWDTETLNGLATVSSEVDRQAQMIGYTNAFVLYTVVAFCTLPLLAFVRIRHR